MKWSVGVLSLGALFGRSVESCFDRSRNDILIRNRSVGEQFFSTIAIRRAFVRRVGSRGSSSFHSSPFKWSGASTIFQWKTGCQSSSAPSSQNTSKNRTFVSWSFYFFNDPLPCSSKNIKKETQITNIMSSAWDLLEEEVAASEGATTTAPPPRFAPTRRVTRTELQPQFLKDLAAARAPILRTLAEILSNTKHRLKVHFHEVVVEEDEEFFEKPWIVMIQGVVDFEMKKLGEKYGFPRGFPLLWYEEDARIVSFGFYPKFDNDTALPKIRLSDFDSAHRITFFRKWSGFLSMVLGFKLRRSPVLRSSGRSSKPSKNGDDCYFYTVTSKNSCDFDSPFVRDAQRIWARCLSQRAVQHLADAEKCVCAETMSSHDQTHGARVLKESVIVTAVGKGCSSRDDFGHAFVEYASLDDVSAFCQDYKLPSDQPVNIEGADLVKKFLTEINLHRDYMTEEKFSEILASLKLPAESLHKQVLGDVLEGLVLHCFSAGKKNAASQKQILKYKFPNYTCRTFALRTIMGGSSLRGGDPGGDPARVLKSQEAMAAFREYVGKWCYSDEGTIARCFVGVEFF